MDRKVIKNQLAALQAQKADLEKAIAEREKILNTGPLGGRLVPVGDLAAGQTFHLECEVIDVRGDKGSIVVARAANHSVQFCLDIYQDQLVEVDIPRPGDLPHS